MLDDKYLYNVINKYDESQLEDTVQKLTEALHRYRGVGLAANQIGINQRVAIVKNKNKIIVLANPMVQIRGNKQGLVLEGCLSLPGYWAKIFRNHEIRITTDQDKVWYNGELAVRIQHEIDHLDGVTIKMRVELGQGVKVNK